MSSNTGVPASDIVSATGRMAARGRGSSTLMLGDHLCRGMIRVRPDSPADRQCGTIEAVLPPIGLCSSATGWIGSNQEAAGRSEEVPTLGIGTRGGSLPPGRSSVCRRGRQGTRKPDWQASHRRTGKTGTAVHAQRERATTQGFWAAARRRASATRGKVLAPECPERLVGDHLPRRPADISVRPICVRSTGMRR